MNTIAPAFAAILALGLAACDRTPQAPADPYANVTLESPPAKVTAERHKGAFAEGSALSMGAELKPLDPTQVKTVRLDTAHRVIEIMPGVKFTAWTFWRPSTRADGAGSCRRPHQVCDDQPQR